MRVMEVLLVATGITGGLTLVWLVRLVASLFSRPPVVSAQFGAGIMDRVLRELAAARREVLLLTDNLTCPAIAQALVEARGRKAQVDVIFGPAAEIDPESSLAFLLDQGLLPLVEDHRQRVAGHVLLVDGRTLLVAAGPFHPDEEQQSAGAHLIVCKDQMELIGSFREQLLGCRAQARQARRVSLAGPMSAPIAPPSFPSYTTPDEDEPLPPAASPPSMLSRPLAPASSSVPERPADREEVLAAVAQGLPQRPTLSDEETECEEQAEEALAGTPTVTLAAAELFARLRREVGGGPMDQASGSP